MQRGWRLGGANKEGCAVYCDEPVLTLPLKILCWSRM